MANIGETIKQIRELEGSRAVKLMLASHLRMRYLRRDSTPATASVPQIRSADGSPVDEAVVELEAQSLEQDAAEIERTLKAAKATETSR